MKVISVRENPEYKEKKQYNTYKTVGLKYYQLFMKIA